MSSCVEDGVSTDVVKLSRIQLPFTFQVFSTSIDIPPHTLSILHKLNHVSLESIRGHRSSEDDSCPKIVQVQKEIHSMLTKSKANLFFGTFQRYENDTETKNILISNFKNEYYHVIYLDNNVKLEELSFDSRTEVQLISIKSDLLAKCNLVIDKSNITNNDSNNYSIDNFSMSPPSSSNHISILQSPQSQDDPLNFLTGRYYLSLYSLSTPLTYFPKTSLSRFKILSENDQERIVDTLEKLHLTTDEMESRHQGKFGILNNIFAEDSMQSTGSIKSDLETQNQKHFTSKNSTVLESMKHSTKISVNNDGPSDANETVNSKTMTTIVEDKFANLVLRLKIREAQLQIIIIFELLHSKKISENEFLAKNLKFSEKELKRKDREAKRSLIRNRNKPKKIVPTFLGTGLSMEERTTVIENSKKLNDYALYKSLNALVDWLGVWDTLLGNASSDDNAYQFLKYVLVPYYSSKQPIVLKYVIDKVKDSNMKFSSLVKGKAVTETSKDSTKIPANKLDAIVPEKPDAVRRTSKFNKVLLKSRKPTLVRSATMGGLDNKDLLPALSIKRSSSNISSKNLQRRQVDMSIAPKKDNFRKPGRSKSLCENIIEPTESLIFGNATRTKTTSFKELRNPAPSSTQIESTPAKPKSKSFSRNKLASVESPFKEFNSNDTNLNENHISQVEATPRHKKPALQEILQTPTVNQIHVQSAVNSSGKSLTGKLMAASLLPTQVESIILSPLSSKSVIDSSPIKSSIGSSSMKRKRPGDPITDESPFFSRYLQEQPEEFTIFKRGKNTSNSPTRHTSNSSPVSVVTSDDDIDSDFERLTTTTTIRKYSKRK